MKPLKDKKITIYKVIAVENENGNYIKKYQPIHPGRLWAYVRGLSAEEYHTSHMSGTQEEAIFTVNWRADLKALMCVLYRDTWYEITRLDAFEGYKDDLRLYVKRIDTPKENLILPYEG